MLNLVNLTDISAVTGVPVDKISSWILALSGTSCLLKNYEDSHSLAPCCAKADLLVETVAKSAYGLGGTAGIMQSAQRFTQWGASRCSYLCAAVEKRDQLDCGAMAALVRCLLSHADEIQSGQLRLIPVSFVAVATEEEIEVWREKFNRNNRQCEWICQPLYYHECVGFSSTRGEVNVWNYDSWLIPTRDIRAQGAIVAWRFDIGDADELQFEGVRVPPNKWFSHEQNPNRPVSTLTDSLSASLPTVFVSGVAVNGDNPSPGVGVARCVRRAFGSGVKLVAVDFSPDSAGLHDSVFDDMMILSSTLRNATDHYQTVLNLLSMAKSSVYMSNLDVEVHLLAECIGTANNQTNSCQMAMELKSLADRILIPNRGALNETSKPLVSALAQSVNFVTPYSIGQNVGEKLGSFLSRVAPFLEATRFPVVVKGKFHDAIVCQTIKEVHYAAKLLEKIWSQEVFIQKCVFGFEESIAFAAYRGKLLCMAHMRKTITTPLGKTWSAQLNLVPSGLAADVTFMVEMLNWTGGGEIEFVRTLEGFRYVIDWNPRFPAWIYGAALEFQNQPALLVAQSIEDMFGLTSQLQLPSATDVPYSFIRTISEIPCKDIQPLILRGPECLASLCISTAKGKGECKFRCNEHPSRNPTMSSILKKLNPTPQVQPKIKRIENKIPPQLSIDQCLCKSTPFRHFDEQQLIRDMNAFKDAILAAEAHLPEHVRVITALSLKTHPQSNIASAAFDNGYLAEVISTDEMDLALKVGFSPSQIVLNGPGKYRPTPNHTALHQSKVIFTDSVKEFEELVNTAESYCHSTVFGVRLAILGTASRFGVDVSDDKTLSRLLDAIKLLPVERQIGFHFHYAPSVLGFCSWEGLCKSFVTSCRLIADATHISPTVVDVGGGCEPLLDSDTTASFITTMKSVFDHIHTQLPSVREIIVEPGKAVTQRCTTLITRVLQIREPTLRQSTLMESHETANISAAADHTCAVVVDASISDVPKLQYGSHPIWYVKATDSNDFALWKVVANGGSDLILGRNCMENDVIATGVQLPEDLAMGDFIAVTNAGAYNTSMSYNFGGGVHC